jgi:hypothetical protein
MLNRTPIDMVEVERDGRFVTGGKPGPGRPVGSRNKLTENFLTALSDDFAEHGVDAIRFVRADKPDQYLKIIASLVPKEGTLTINDASDMTEGELVERLRNITATIAPFLIGGGGEANEATGGDTIEAVATRVH